MLPCGVDAYQNLIEEVLNELLLERPTGKKPVKISPKQFSYEVDVLQRRNEDVAE